MIADYGMRSLKKFCKLFNKYSNTNFWSAPEIWGDHQKDFFDSLSVDVYSYGMLLWEIETGSRPFDGLDDKQIKVMLLERRLRPLIPKTTDH